MISLGELVNILPQTGSVEWIGVRPAKFAQMCATTEIAAEVDRGLVGDRYARRGGKRQVTLIQAEHLEAMASMLDLASLEPQYLRRNIVVRGLNLLALKGKQFQICGAVLEYSGLCHPCSRMETVLGPGGYNATRGHGGINAKVVVAGNIRTNDKVRARWQD